MVLTGNGNSMVTEAMVCVTMYFFYGHDKTSITFVKVHDLFIPYLKHMFFF